MGNKVTALEKKEFIRWLSITYQFKDLKAVDILEFMLRQERRCGDVHFVKDASRYNRGITLSVQGTKWPAFEYHKNGEVKLAVDVAFTDVRVNEGQKLYVQFVFPGSEENLRYKELMEESPAEYREETQMSKFATIILEEAMQTGNRKRILAMIDEALDNGNKEEVERLSKLLQNFPEIKEKEEGTLK